MTYRKAISLTARREIRERLRSRAFQASVAIQVLIVLLIVVISALTGDDGKTYDVGLDSTGSSTIGATLEEGAPAGVEIVTTEVADDAATRGQVADGELDAAILGEALISGPDTDEELTALLQAAAGRSEVAAGLESAGLAENEIAAALDPAGLEVEEVGQDSGAAEGIAFVGSLLLYLGILGFGFVVTSGIVEEKGSRVVELILSTIKPSQLLAGKVIGIGLLGLLQLVLTAGVGIAAALISGQIDLPASTAETTALVLVYFILGYALYACAFAVAGAMVSRQEDVGSVTTPLTIILVAGYLASFGVSGDPGGTLATVLTLLPATSPLVVPARAAVDGLPTGELIASIVLLVASTFALIWLAARIYERAVLRVGAPLGLRETLRLVRSPAD